jgi:hypothetical protein
VELQSVDPTPERAAGAGSRHLQQRAGHRLKYQQEYLLTLVDVPLRLGMCPGLDSDLSHRPLVPHSGAVAVAATYSDW